VVLKLKTADFRTLTRNITPPAPPQTQVEFEQLALSLLQRVELERDTLYRLVGVGLTNFEEPSAMPELPFD
jgi:DNA polymerase-4